MAPSFSRVSSGALLLALAYNAQPVKADFWEDVDNCKLVLDDLPADLTTDFCNDFTYGYEPENDYVTVTGQPVTVTEYPDAQTCTDEGGYETSTKEGYPTSTPGFAEGYQPSKPTWHGAGSNTTVEGYPKPTSGSSEGHQPSKPDESTKVPGETTKAPDYPPPTDVPEGGYDVTVTSTTTTTYWTTSTIYPDYPAATPAPYRRHARDVSARTVKRLQDRASWCDDRPCRLVQYDDDTIVEACKKYLGWEPTTSTVNVPGYTVVVTSYPTDCQKKDNGYKPDPVPAYPTDTPEPYPTEEPDYPTETPDYPEYPTETDYAPYPTETPEYEPEPYPESYPTDAPAPYAPDDGSSYDDGSYDDGSYDDGSYDDGSAPSEDDGTDDYQQSDDNQAGQNDFDNNYSGPDGPLPWDDADQTQELADAIDAGGYDQATQELGLDDAAWNALPGDSAADSGSGGGSKRRDVDYDSYQGYSPDQKDDSNYPTEDSSAEDCSTETDTGYPTEESSYPTEDYPTYDDSEDSYPAGEPEDDTAWVLPDSDEYEGDEYESDPYPESDEAPDYSGYDSYGEDGVDDY